MNKRRRFKRPPPNPSQTEVTLVWKDESRCQATVPLGKPHEVTCGNSRFMRTESFDVKHGTPVYEEIRV